MTRFIPAVRQAVSLRSERGVSLIATLMIMAGISILGASAIYYSSRNQASAEFAADQGNSTNVAEAGMNFARSILFDVVDNDGDPTDESALPAKDNPAVATVDGHTVSYYGAFDSATSTWTLTGEASVVNPTGSGSVTRAVESKVVLVPKDVWLWDFSFSKPDSCVTIANNIDYVQPFKVDGDVCMSNSARLTGEYVEISGTLELLQSSGIGTPAEPLDYVNIVGGCTRGGLHVCNPNAPDNDDVHADAYYTDPFSENKPVLDWPVWYADADLGPASPCTTGSFSPGSVLGEFDNNYPLSDGSLGIVELTPASSYTCTSATGEISWDSPTNTLTVDGVIFIDGDVLFNQNISIQYDGRATIYVNGDLNVANLYHFCGVAACDDTWDTFVDSVIFAVAGDLNLRNNSIFQAGAVVDGDYSILQSSQNFGPVIATNFTIQNAGASFIPITGAMPGLPGFGDTTTIPGVLDASNVANSYISYTPDAGSEPN